MDVATIKGVADRLMKRGLVRSEVDNSDARRRLLALTPAGRAFVERHCAGALAISADTLAPLTRAGAIGFHDPSREADLEAGCLLLEDRAP